jgi:hypothetical protein
MAFIGLFYALTKEHVLEQHRRKLTRVLEKNQKKEALTAGSGL